MNPLLWGPLDQDHRHRFTTSWVLDLPGRHEGPMKWVVGGWQWTGVMQFQTGQPFNVISGTDNSLAASAHTDRAKLTGVSRSTRRRVRFKRVWFNPAAFAVNDVGTFGDVPKGFLLRAVTAQLGYGAVQELPDRRGHERAVPRRVLQRLQPGELRHPGNVAERQPHAVNGANFGKITRTDPASEIRGSSSSG